MTTARPSGRPVIVALRAEGVDRNQKRRRGSSDPPLVALLAEGVDRNPSRKSTSVICTWVALLAEGVDRNYLVIDRNAKGQCRPPRGGRG